MGRLHPSLCSRWLERLPPSVCADVLDRLAPVGPDGALHLHFDPFDAGEIPAALVLPYDRRGGGGDGAMESSRTDREAVIRAQCHDYQPPLAGWPGCRALRSLL